MPLLSGLIASVVVAALAALVWAAVTVFMGVELGILAWGIGIVVGLAMMIATGRRGGFGGGVLAAGVSLAAIAAGKYLAIVWILAGPPPAEVAVSYIADRLAMEDESAGVAVVWPEPDADGSRYAEEHYPPDIWARAQTEWDATPAEIREVVLIEPVSMSDPQSRTSFFADAIMEERSAAGKDADPDSADSNGDYPPDVWAAAEERERSMTPAEQAEFLRPHAERTAEVMNALMPRDPAVVFRQTLGPFDLVWAALAVFTAFRLGAASDRQAPAGEPERDADAGAARDHPADHQNADDPAQDAGAADGDGRSA